jgi:N-methylhydantoinase A
VVGELAARAREELGAPDAALRVVCDLRYRGQAFELPVAAGEAPDPDALREAFAAAHEEAYGFRDPDAAVELVTVRVVAAVPGPELDARAVGASATGAERLERAVILDGVRCAATVLRGEPEPGTAIEGPAICELPESTLAVPAGWAGMVEPAGSVLLERRP